MITASIADYREAARRRVPHFLFEYLDGGSYDEVTLRRNIEDLRAISLRQRVMRDVSSVDLSTELLGQTLKMPLALAPIGLGGMYARRGEVQAARAAKAAGVPFTLSTVGVCPLAEVVAGAGGNVWFQLYVIRDRAYMRDLLAEAAAQGVNTLFLTVDLPMPGARHRDFRSGGSGAPGLAGKLRRLAQTVARPKWAWDVGLNGKPHALGNLVKAVGRSAAIGDFQNWIGRNFDPSLNWADLEWIRESWKGRLLLKGVLDPEDAKLAVAHGVDGIVVSNHGGRQLDGVLSSARALPPIVDAVGGELTVLADGGVRSGLDVVRLLALGARGVLIGRAWAYALAAGGEVSVAHALRLLGAEMRIAMALTGVTRVADITRDCLVG